MGAGSVAVAELRPGAQQEGINAGSDSDMLILLRSRFMWRLPGHPPNEMTFENIRLPHPKG
jgi:hypothetical protein